MCSARKSTRNGVGVSEHSTLLNETPPQHEGSVTDISSVVMWGFI